MAADFEYERLVVSFGQKRHELLELITEIVPRAAELHRRRWRVQQLENTISDLKMTVTACNNQLDTERAKLDELGTEGTRLRAQEVKLAHDLRILQGVTRLDARFPRDGSNATLDSINSMAESFRANFSTFFFDLPPIGQELPIDPTLSRDSQILVSTLEDFIRIQFDVRSSDAHLSKDVGDKAAIAEQLELEVKEKELHLEREIERQRARIRNSAVRMRQSIDGQAAELRRQGEKINTEYEKMIEDLKKSTADLAFQEEKLNVRCQHLETYQRSSKENLRRKVMEIETELDLFDHRLEVIRAAPHTVDQRLVNMSLILSKKAWLVEDGVRQMRQEIVALLRSLHS